MKDLGLPESEAWQAESTGLQLLKIVGRKQILIFRVLAHETGDIRTERDNAQMIGAGKIERNPGELCPQALAFQRLRHFGVVKKDTIGKAAIGQQRLQAVRVQFEALGVCVVRNGYIVEIHVHEAPLRPPRFLEFFTRICG